MSSGWAAFLAAIALNLMAFGVLYGVLKGKVDALGPLIAALGSRIDEVQKDIRELRALIMGKQDK